MTNDEAKAFAKTLTYSQAIYNAMQGKSVPYKKATKYKLTEMAEKIKVLEAQPSEDCISRKAVIDHICEYKECYEEECKGRTLKRCPDLQWVFDLPSVTPQSYKAESEDI